MINILSSKFLKVILFFILLFAFNAYSEEPAPDRCFAEFLEAINDEEIKGKQRVSYLIKKENNSPLELNYWLNDPKKPHVQADKSNFKPISFKNCENIKTAKKQFSEDYKTQISSLIEEEEDFFKLKA